MKQKTVSGREIALRVLNRIEKDGAYPNIAAKEEFQKTSAKREDKGFANELYMGTLRNKIYLDYAISKFLKLKFNKIALPILNILRMSAYQILFLKNIPQSAVCNEAVTLAKRYGHQASSGFVNGLLRNMSRNFNEISLPPKEKDIVQYLSIKESFPVFLVEKFIRDFGRDFAGDLIPSLNQPQKMRIRVNLLKISREDLLLKLRTQGIEAHQCAYTREGLELDHSFSIESSELFQQGYFTVQGFSSQLASIVLRPQKNEQVLDLCAAPGGKTTHIGELLQNTGQILASDFFEHKIELIRKNAMRLGLTNIRPLKMDATQLNPELIHQFNKILCDVPCSGLGVLAKKPDIKYNTKIEDFIALIKLQEQILDNAAEYLKVGGELVYSTCTVNKDENIAQIRSFLEKHQNFEACDISDIFDTFHFSDSESLKQGYLELYPHLHNTDGFFIAKLKKVFEL